MKKKRKKEEYYDDLWMYVLLLTTLVILLEAIKNYTFTVFSVSLTYAIFLLPFVFLIVNYISKKYDYKKAVAAISISAVIFVSFTTVVAFALNEKLILGSLTGEFCAYVVSQFVNLTIYNFLLDNTKMPELLIYFNYLFALIVYYLFYTLIHLDMILLDSYWTGYFLTLAIQTLICIPLATVDKKIKRGQEKIVS